MTSMSRDQARARVGAFDQVVAEQRIAREAPVEHPVHRVHFIDPFAGKNAFAIKVLVNVGDSARVDVEPGLTGVDAGQARTRRALHAHADARLQNAVAGDHDVLLGIDDRLVQRMRHRADHAMRPIRAAIPCPRPA